MFLVIRRSCLTLKVVDNLWLHTSLFHSTCTVNGKVCRFIIDSESCENVVSEEAVQKLALHSKNHPAPYKLAWLNQGSKVKVSHWALVSFSVGTTYREKIYCYLVPLDACHILLG